MTLSKVRIQLQRFLGCYARFLSSSRHRVEIVIGPTLNLRKSGIGRGEIWIEFDRSFEKFLGLLRRLMRVFSLGGVIARLQVKQVSVLVLRRARLESCLFVRGKAGL